jgi:hypothetical protein
MIKKTPGMTVESCPFAILLTKKCAQRQVDRQLPVDLA